MDWWALLQTFLGTLLAAAIGIPVGLYLNRKAQALAGKEAKDTEERRLRDALSLLRSSIKMNIAGLDDLASKYEGIKGLTVVPGISGAAWTAVGRDVVRTLPNLELRADLVRFFDDLRSLEEMNQTLVEYTIGLHFR